MISPGLPPATHQGDLRQLQPGLALLIAERRWVVWKWELSPKNNWTKVPYQAERPALRAASTRPDTWSHHAAAVRAVEDGRATGIGFMLRGGHVAAFDLDNCRDPSTGEVKPWAWTLIDEAQSYAEVTVSGTGLRIIGLAVGDKVHRKQDVPGTGGSLETYRGAERFIVVTGLKLAGAYDELTNLDAIIDRTVARLDRKPGNPADPPFGIDEHRSGTGKGKLTVEPLVAERGCRDRSAQFQRAVGAALRAGMTPDELEAMMRQYIEGCASKYLEGRDRLREEIERSWRKVEAEETPRAEGASVLDPRDPMGSARAFVASFTADGLRCIHHHRGGFYEWNRACYRAADDDTVRAKVWGFLDQALRLGRDSKEEPFRPTRSRVTDVLDALAAVANLPGSIEAPTWLSGAGSRPPAAEMLPVANGLLHLPSGDMHPPNPLFFGLNAAPLAYNPAAPEPEQWHRFLKDLFGADQEAKDTLQDVFGYSLTPDTGQQKIILIVGPTRSGKGTIARVLTELVGRGNVAAPTLASLSSNFGLAPLIGKPVAIISDARLGTKSDQAAIAERLLSISGEDSLTIDRKFLSAWTGRLPTRFLIFTNELPRLADASGALANRFVVLSLGNSFLGREDQGLTSRLIGELPGILNWARRGYLRLRQRGYFVQPASAREAIEDLETLGSPVKAFVRERCIVSPDREITTKSLYAEWTAWCLEGGRQPGAEHTFGRDLKAALPALRVTQPRRHDARVRVYVGIGLASALYEK